MILDTFPLPPPLLDYTWRSIRHGDIAAIQALTAVTAPVDNAESAASEARIVQIFEMLGEDLNSNTLTAVTPDGHIAAIALFFIPPTEDDHLALIDTLVHPQHRHHPLDATLLEWLEQRICQEFAEYPDTLPQLIRANCYEQQTAHIKTLEQLAFTAVRFNDKMRCPLTHPLPVKPLPRGLKRVIWSPDLDIPLLHAFNEAFSESWDVPVMNESLWQQSFTAVPQFRGDLTYLVLDGDTIVGFCVNWVDPDKNAQIGVAEGWIEALGVIPAWRGRGIASALITHTLNAFMGEQLERAALSVDTQNPTGALRLYQKFGFASAKRMITFEKQLN